MAQGNRPLHGGRRNPFSRNSEMHVDLRENLWVFFRALTGHLYAAALYLMAPALEDQHHVIRSAPASARRISPSETTSAPAPSRAKVAITAWLELAFSE